MTATMIRKPKPKASAVEPAPPLFASRPETQVAGKAVKTFDNTPSEKLRNECVGCRLRINRFGTSKGVDDATKTGIAAHMGITKKRSISVSHKIYDDSHPTIKKANDFFGRVEKYWKSMTLPLASIYSDEVATEGGTRLLKADQADTFNTQMKVFNGECEVIQRELNEKRADILKVAQEMLGDRFDSKAYPAEFFVSIHWGYPEVTVPAGLLKNLAPRAFEHERSLLVGRFERTIEHATCTMLRDLNDVLAATAQALGPVTRIYPPDKHPLEHRHGAEVFRSEDNGQNPELVPVGKLRLLLRWREKDKKELQSEWTESMTRQEYVGLNPSEIGTEKRKFHDSTITNLLDMVAKVRKLGGVVEKSDDLAKAATEIEKHLAQCGDAEGAALELRDSNIFRNQTHKLMAGLSEAISKSLVNYTEGRRKVDRAVVAPG